MNLFILGYGIDAAAAGYCQLHYKIVLEIAQMMCTAKHKGGGTWPESAPALYRKTHENHPVSRWVRACIHNYTFAGKLAIAINKELKSVKDHKSVQLIRTLLEHPPLHFGSDSIKRKRAAPHVKFFVHTIPNMEHCTPFPLCWGMDELALRSSIPTSIDPNDLVAVTQYLYATSKAHVWTGGYKGRVQPIFLTTKYK